MKGFGNRMNLKEKTKNQISIICHDLSITRSVRREKKSYDDDDKTAMTVQMLMCISHEVSIF
jgi:hypothetical protein